MLDRAVKLMLVIATFAAIVYVAINHEEEQSVTDPNPMKQNQEQFARIAPVYYAKGIPNP